MKNIVFIFLFLVPCLARGYSQYFTDTNLPIVIISTDNGVAIPDAPRVFGNMKIIRRGTGDRNFVTDQDSSLFLNYTGRISIEIRGSSTQVLPKKQYGFSTLMAGDTVEKNASFLGLPAENDWVLNGMSFDPVLIRDYICYNLFRKMGEYASRTVYCEVIINNSYEGLYLLQEKVKQGPDRVNVMKISKSDYFLPNLTGGYITKADKITGGDPVAWTMSSYVAGQDVMFIHVLPKPENVTPLQNDYIKNQFFNLQTTASADNASVETGYPSIIDIPSFIDYMIITEFSSNSDNYQYSTFFHKDRNGKLRAGPIWDSDLTFGNDIFFWGLDRSHSDVWQFANGDNQGPYFWKDLYFSQNFRCSFFKRWKELTQAGGPLNGDTLVAFINKTGSNIYEAVDRNNTRWNNKANFNSGLNDIESFIYKRISWINSWAESNTGCTDPVLAPLVITKIMYNPDSTGAYPKSKDYEFLEIKNTGTKIVSLSGDYFLGTGFVYQFPPYSVLNPGGTKVLASNEFAFRQKYGFAPSGQFTRNLSNDGEKLILADGFGNIIDYVKYSNAVPWPDADGNGAYLELTDVNLDNNDPVNWIANHNSVVKVDMIPAGERVKLYPVPARHNVTLQSDISVERIDLYSMQGLLIRSGYPKSTEYDLDISSLPEGIYYVKIATGSGIYVRKIVKE
jgi:hypothetical protein